VIEKIRALPKGTDEREEAAVDEYCRSLREICGFRYVSQAIIMDASKEKIRYYFVFATNSLHGIQVFKEAEAKAAIAQDEVRHETKIKKKPQFELAFGGPRSSKVQYLQERYTQRSREAILSALSEHRRGTMSYDELYGKAMAFPLVKQSDLDHILLALAPNVELKLTGTRRKKPILFRGDYVIVH
jgi:hypothetical protein